MIERPIITSNEIICMIPEIFIELWRQIHSALGFPRLVSTRPFEWIFPVASKNRQHLFKNEEWTITQACRFYSVANLVKPNFGSKAFNWTWTFPFWKWVEFDRWKPVQNSEINFIWIFQSIHDISPVCRLFLIFSIVKFLTCSFRSDSGNCQNRKSK